MISKFQRQNAFNVENGYPLKTLKVVDIGAKMTKISRVLEQRCSLGFYDIFGKVITTDPHILKSLPLWIKEWEVTFERATTVGLGPARVAVARDAYIAATELFVNTPWPYVETVKRQVPDINNPGAMVAVDVLVNKTVSIEACLERKLRGADWYLRLGSFGCVHYQPVRPRVDPYDVNYYSKQLQAYQNEVIRQGHRLSSIRRLPVHVGYVQEWEKGVQNATESFAYLLFDCHYYLQGWQPLIQGEVFLVGGEFHSLPGRYILPMFEGTYEVTAERKNGVDKAMMTMYTSSSGTSYMHPLVHVSQPQFRMDYGYYAHLAHQCHSTQLKIFPVIYPRFANHQLQELSGCSVQAQWVRETAKTFEKGEFSNVEQLVRQFDGMSDMPRLRFDTQNDTDVIRDFSILTHDFQRVAEVEMYVPLSLVARLWAFFTSEADFHSIRTISRSKESTYDFAVRPEDLFEVRNRSTMKRCTGSRLLNREEVFRVRFGCTAEKAAFLGGELSKKRLAQCAKVDIVGQNVKMPKNVF